MDDFSCSNLALIVSKTTVFGEMDWFLGEQNHFWRHRLVLEFLDQFSIDWISFCRNCFFLEEMDHFLEKLIVWRH